jgi:hypothetical protein
MSCILATKNESPRSRTVTFSKDTKSYDGSSSKNIFYYKLIMTFFKNEKFDELLSQCLLNKDLIKYCIKEAKLARNKLKNIIIENENEQFKDFFKLLFKIKNNIEKSEWENDFYNKKVLEKNKKGVAILRNGCQGINDKFLPKHLKKLEIFIDILEKNLN